MQELELGTADARAQQGLPSIPGLHVDTRSLPAPKTLPAPITLPAPTTLPAPRYACFKVLLSQTIKWLNWQQASKHQRLLK